MKTFLTLAWREIVERRMLLLASAILGFLPLVLPFVPGIPARSTPEELRAAAVIILAMLFGGGSLVVLGATIVGRDLSEGRLAFYFARPVSGWTLWASRLAAACALVLASLALLAAPAAVLDAGDWMSDLSDARNGQAWPLLAPSEIFYPSVGVDELPATPPRAVNLAYALGLMLALLALSHAVSTIVRSHSPMLLADLAGLAAVAAVAWGARGILVREQAFGALTWAQWLLVPWLLGALGLAGGLQLVHGRTDLRRGHRILSATLWPLLIAGALALGVYARWVAASDLEDLEELIFADASAREDWLLAGGPVRGRAGAAAAFLLDVDSGESWRLGSLNVVRVLHAFGGGAFVWARCESFRPPDCRIWTKDLDDRDSPPRATGIMLFEDSISWALAGDGSRLAMTTGDKIAVYELASARLLIAVESELVEDVSFLTPDLVRYHEAAEQDDGSFRTRIREIDLVTRRSVTTGWLPRGTVIRRSPARDAVLFRRFFPAGFGLYDGRTGESLFEPEDLWRPLYSRGRFLSDGRIVLTAHGGDQLTLLLLSPEGEEIHRVERAGVTGVHLGGELTPGRMLVALREIESADSADRSTDGLAPDLTPPETDPLPHLKRVSTSPMPPGTWSIYALDGATGELTRRLEGVMPLGAAEAGSQTRLLWSVDGEVEVWRPATGERRTLLPIQRSK